MKSWLACCVDQAGLEPATIFLLQPPGKQDYRHMPHLAALFHKTLVKGHLIFSDQVGISPVSSPTGQCSSGLINHGSLSLCPKP